MPHTHTNSFLPLDTGSCLCQYAAPYLFTVVVRLKFVLVFITENILAGSVHTVKENAETVVVASKEIRLEANADKTKYMVMSGDQNAGQSHEYKHPLKG